MAVKTMDKAERENLVFRVENLPDKFMFQIKGYVERLEEEILREEAEEKYNEYFNPYNMKILMESIEQAKNGQIITKTIAELEAMESD